MTYSPPLPFLHHLALWQPLVKRLPQDSEVSLFMTEEKFCWTLCSGWFGRLGDVFSCSSMARVSCKTMEEAHLAESQCSRLPNLNLARHWRRFKFRRYPSTLLRTWRALSQWAPTRMARLILVPRVSLSLQLQKSSEQTQESALHPGVPAWAQAWGMVPRGRTTSVQVTRGRRQGGFWSNPRKAAPATARTRKSWGKVMMVLLC